MLAGLSTEIVLADKRKEVGWRGRHLPVLRPEDGLITELRKLTAYRADRVMYMSALAAVRCDPTSRAYYQRKVRHEALDVRGEVEDLRRLAVAAAGLKLGAA